MPRIRLMHWNAVESVPIRALLTKAGFAVEYDETYASTLMREWRQNPPTAFVIDLSRLPAQGMEIAIALRQSPKTKTVPIVFCEGAPEKVERVRQMLPDAPYCTAKTLVRTVKGVRPITAPAKPVAMMDRYGQKATAQKLGIVQGSKVTVIDAPRNLNSVLGDLPADVELVDRDGAVTLCFVHSVDALRAAISDVRTLAATSKLWILHCKKSSPSHNGVTEGLVRDTGIDLGLVDYKICSVDKDWSGMLFANRTSRK